VSGILHAGVARKLITPELGIKTAGFYSREGVVEEIESDLTATVAVLRSNHVTVVIAALDLCMATVETMLERDQRLIESNPSLDEVVRQQQLDNFEVTRETFATLFDRGAWEELRAQGKRRLSHEAFLAALLISLYRDEPALHLPFRLLTVLVDVDEGFTAFRNAHAQLVHRSIGGRIGTGGTSGHEYLQAAARKHQVFTDLFDLATYHLPRRELPPLPDDVRSQMSFRFVEE
jgi:tryptophan 2,3-dioxygenase